MFLSLNLKSRTLRFRVLNMIESGNLEHESLMSTSYYMQIPSWSLGRFWNTSRLKANTAILVAVATPYAGRDCSGVLQNKVLTDKASTLTFGITTESIFMSVRTRQTEERKYRAQTNFTSLTSSVYRGWLLPRTRPQAMTHEQLTE